MIHFTCNNCGQEISVSSQLLGKRGRCTACGAILRIEAKPASSGQVADQDDKSSRVSLQTEHPSHADGRIQPGKHGIEWRYRIRAIDRVSGKAVEPIFIEGTSRKDALRKIDKTRIMVTSICAPAQRWITAACVLIAVSIAIGLWASRDTWEADNRAQISARCEAVLLAIQESDDQKAAFAYAELNRFIGQHEIEREPLARQVGEVRAAFVPVNERLEKAQRDLAAQELANEQHRTLLTDGTRAGRQTQGTKSALSPSGDGYKGFSESELQRLYQKLLGEGCSSEEAILTLKAVLDYPDTRAVAREWLKDN